MTTQAIAQHTPGPWKLVPQTNGSAMVAREYETGKQMQPKGLRLIANVLARGNSLEQDEANARLIASAPELLAELKQTVAQLEAIYEECKRRKLFEVTVEQFRQLDVARAAIAKAEGRSDA